FLAGKIVRGMGVVVPHDQSDGDGNAAQDQEVPEPGRGGKRYLADEVPAAIGRVGHAVCPEVEERDEKKCKAVGLDVGVSFRVVGARAIDGTTDAVNRGQRRW